MATTPVWAIPYPVGTDRVMDGDNAMASIAGRVDNLIRSGVTSLTTNTGGDASVVFAVPFPTALLTAVVCEASDPGGPMFVKYLTAYSDRTRISVRAFGSNGSILPSWAFKLSWIAIGS